MHFALIIAHGHEAAVKVEVQVESILEDTNGRSREVLVYCLTWNVHHSNCVFLPFRTKAKQLTTGVEFEVCNGGCQVHYLFRRLGAQCLSCQVEVKQVYSAHFAS